MNERKAIAAILAAGATPKADAKTVVSTYLEILTELTERQEEEIRAQQVQVEIE